MSLRGLIHNGHGAPAAHAHQRTHQRTHQQKSVLWSCATVAVVAVLFVLPAYCLAANPGAENRDSNSNAKLTDNPAADDISADKTPDNTAANTAMDKTAVDKRALDKRAVDNTAVDKISPANQPSTPHPLAINTEIDPDDAEPPSVAPGASASGTFAPSTLAPVGALPLVGIAGEPAPTRRCFLVVPGLCAAARNKPIVALAAIQAAALIADGVTTRQYLKRGYVEVDPLTRILIGRKPTWARMAPLGTVQVVAGMWLAERMETSRHPWIRRLWWLPQLVGIAGNTAATANNLQLH